MFRLENIIVNMTTFQNLISRLYAIPIKISTALFTELNKLIIKFTQTWNSNITLKNKKNVGVLTSHNKTYFKATVIKTRVV